MKFILNDITDSKFIPGQVWNYNTREGEESSEVTVLKVDSTDTLGNIVHVSVNGLNIKIEQDPEKLNDKIMHMPFAEDAFDASITEKIMEHAELPDYLDGYNTWKEAFEDGKAGIFSISIRDAIEAMEQALNS